jgi:hypothetical protein
VNDDSPCNPANFASILVAKAQITGGDIFTEAERMNEMNDTQQFHYENTFAKEFGLSPVKENGSSAWDKNPNEGHPLNDFNDSLYGYPSRTLPPKFYKGVVAKWETWAKTKDPKQYGKMVGQPVKTLLAAIQKSVEGANPKADLMKLGLTQDKVYDARGWLEWLADGGTLQKDKRFDFMTNATNKLTKAQALYNTVWTIGHGPAMLRIGTHYAVQPGGLKALFQGIYDAGLKDNGFLSMRIFRRDPSLLKAGIYQTQYAEFDNPNRDPFSWGITAQKNLIYHTAKAMGRDPHDDARDLIFDSHPIDKPHAYRSVASNFVYGLARYPINETRWYFQTLYKGLTGDKSALAAITIYTILKSTLYGTNSNIPAPVWAFAVPDKTKKDWHAWDKAHGLNQISIQSGKAFRSMGINAEIDASGYTQPLGGQLGARGGALKNTGGTAVGATARSGVSLVHGQIPAALASTAAAASAILNLTGTTSALKYLNSTTLTRILNIAGRQMDPEFKKGDNKTAVLKGVFGSEQVKKAAQ